MKQLYGLSEIALIDMGDFVGGMLKYLRTHPVPRVTIAGGFAKMSKLAAGRLDLHSKRGVVDLNLIADWLRELGANERVVEKARGEHRARNSTDFGRSWGAARASRRETSPRMCKQNATKRQDRPQYCGRGPRRHYRCERCLLTEPLDHCALSCIMIEVTA